MGENQSEIPGHPYDDPQQYKELYTKTSTAWIVWNRVSILYRERNGQVEPEEVVDLFNDPKRKDDLWPNCTLYDVWLMATWQADKWIAGGPTKIPDEHVTRHAQLDQIEALIERAMDLAGHRPEEAPGPEPSK